MALAISVINYKTLDLTRNCLKSILDKKWKTPINIWLVDNASNDGSLEALKKEFPKINFIESKQNLGFAAGHNLALKKNTDDFVLLLNSDAIVSEGGLDIMVNFMKENNCHIAGCKLINSDGSLQPSSGDFPFGLSLINWLFNFETLGFKSPSFHRNEPEFYEKPHEVDWLTGGFMMIKRDLLEKIGLLSEDYFMYFEDVEFCFRAKKNGFKVMINTDVVVTHLSGGSSKDPRLRQWSGELKNLIYFYKNEFGVGSSILLKSLIYLSTILRMIAFTAVGKLATAKTYGKVIAGL